MKVNMRKINDITSLLQHIVLPYIEIAKVVVDCTCGNGYDSIFILENLSKDSKLYGFDIQKIAIDNTDYKLNKLNCKCKNYRLINDSHSKIDEYINENIDVAFFNLGYLPGADHSLTTKQDTTILAIEKILNLLSKGGIISILIYSGHNSGKIEKKALLNYFENLDGKTIKLMRTDFPTSPNNPPEIYVLQKIK